MHALAQAREVSWKPIPVALGVRVLFSVWFPSGNQKDPINYTENLLDALEGIAYENDSQAIEVVVILEGYDKADPRIEVIVEPTDRARPVPPSRQKKRGDTR